MPLPPSNFDYHFPGQWKLMYPGFEDRDYAQLLQLKNGVIPQMDYATCQAWQGASSIQYLNIDTPQLSLTEGQTIMGLLGATGTILTDDGVTLTFIETGGNWAAEHQFTSSGPPAATCTINTGGYTPGAAVLPANAALEGSGAIPQHVWITATPSDCFDLGAIMFCPNSYTIGPYGLGGFLNPDYQNVGDYSGLNAVTGIGTYLGNWAIGPVSAGDIVYNAGVDNKFYVNITGVNTPPPSTD